MRSKPPAPSDLADKFMLRLPEGMRDRIAGAAQANNRSMNSEIVARLAASLAPDATICAAGRQIEALQGQCDAIAAALARLEDELIGPKKGS